MKTGNVESCILSGPVLKEKSADTPTGKKAKKRRRNPTHSEDSIKPSVEPPPREREGDAIRPAFAHISPSDLTKAIISFQAQFPEFGFLHPDDLDHQGELTQLSDIRKLRLIAIYVVAGRYNQSLPLARIDTAFIMQELHKRVACPNLLLIQSFLIMSLYTWGKGDSFNAWMSVGIASRMAQGILNVHISSSRKRPLSEKERRTFWTCFAMDRLLSCGKGRPVMLTWETMDIPLPGKHTSFVYGEPALEDTADGRILTSAQALYSMDDYFAIIVRGLDIWSKVHTWTVEGGRKQPSMTEPEQCPWEITSQWKLMKQELQTWRESQHLQLRYPETKASIHIHLRQAEKFGYINLIYYVRLVSLQPLHRAMTDSFKV